jgi:hypothetical protein
VVREALVVLFPRQSLTSHNVGVCQGRKEILLGPFAFLKLLQASFGGGDAAPAAAAADQQHQQADQDFAFSDLYLFLLSPTFSRAFSHFLSS